VTEVLVSKEKNFFSLLGVFVANFPLFIDVVQGYKTPAAWNAELGVLLMLSTMLGTVFRVYNMLLNINFSLELQL
jgi:hypothetical protein